MYSVKRSEATKLALHKRDVYVYIGGDKLKGQNLTIGMTEVPARTAMEPHTHADREEAIFVLEGVGEAIVGGHAEALAPQTAVLFPIGVPHQVENKGDGVLRFVFAFNPVNDFNGAK